MNSPSGQREDEAFRCSSLYLPQSLQSQRRSSSIWQPHLPPLQFLHQRLLQLHSCLSFASSCPGLLTLLGLCSLPYSAQRWTWASCPGSCVGLEPAWGWSVRDQHRDGPSGVHDSGPAGAAAPWSSRHQTVQGRKLLVELLCGQMCGVSITGLNTSETIGFLKVLIGTVCVQRSPKIKGLILCGIIVIYPCGVYSSLGNKLSLFYSH